MADEDAGPPSGPAPHSGPPVKNAQRLDEARLAEVLNERGMADPEGLREMLQSSQAGGTPFCGAVVSAGLVSDWDLSRVVAELFQLPFLPVDICRPDRGLWPELASSTLEENSVVPVSRFGRLLTVAMPGLVSADVLGALAAETDYYLLPVVGTVETNRRWIKENSASPASTSGDWGSVFDEGDAAVQASLDTPGDAGAASDPGLEALELTSEKAGGQGPGWAEPPSLIDTAEPEALPAEEPAPLDLPPPPAFG